MRSLKLFSLMVFFLFNFTQVRAEASSHALLLECLHQNCFEGAKTLEGRKLYLEEGALFPTASGMFFFGKNGDSVSIQCLNSDAEGCHVYLSASEAELIEYAWDGNILNKCPGCGLRYFLTCKNPDCPLKQDED